MNIDVNRPIVALLCTVLATGETAAETGDKDVTLRVKPQLCITSRRDQACKTSFLVHWESEQSDDYCLRDDESSFPLRCWLKESLGRFEQDRVVVESFSYWLTKPGYERPLAEARVELMTIDSSDRRRYRRNRHAWSIR